MIAALAMLIASVVTGTALAVDSGTSVDSDTQTVQTDSDGTGADADGVDDADGDSDDGGDAGSDGGSDDGTADGADADADGSGDSDVDAVEDSGVSTLSADGTATLADGDGSGSGNLLTEDFTEKTFANADEWTVLGDACLTAADSGDYACKTNSTSTRYYHGSQYGDGFLQLTDDVTASTGTVLNNTVIQTSLGLDISFYQYQFGQSSPLADGIGFFLVDADEMGEDETIEQGPQGGDVGGALGYSAIVGSRTLHEGIAYGVLGIGLDTYGNYSSEQNVGGADTRDSEYWAGYTGGSISYVTVRGPGEYTSSCPTYSSFHNYSGNVDRWNSCETSDGGWYNGYDILGRTQVNANLLNTGSPEKTDGNQSENESGQAGGTLVHITISTPAEDGSQTLTVELTSDSGQGNTTTVKLDEGTLPDTVMFGFSASTGDCRAAHFIRGLEVSTLEESSGIMLTKVALNAADAPFQAGDTVSYRFTVTNTGTTDLTDVTIKDDTITFMCTVNDDGSLTSGSRNTASCYANYTLTKDDVSGGSFTNTAMVTGMTPDGETLTDEDSVTVQTIPSLGTPDHYKTIENNEDGTYTLSLDVTGETQTTQTTTTGTQAVDVVFVLDKSTSMGGCVGDTDSTSCQNGTSRLNAMKKAATNLVDTIFDAKGIDARIGVVAFSGSATVVSDFSNLKNVVDSAITSITMPKYGDGTDWYDGLSAVSQYQTRKDARKFVVFLTDGNPNRTGNSNNYIETTTHDKGIELVKDGWNILNIGVDLTSQARTRLQKLTNAEAAVKTDDQVVNLYDSTDEDGLNDIFEEIGQIITISTTYGYSGVTITDTLSDYAEFPDGFSQSDVTVTVIGTDDQETMLGSEYYTVTVTDNKTVTVTFADGFVLQDGVTYRVTFPVVPTQKAYDDYASGGYTDTGGANTGDSSAGQDGFYSNSDAFVSYKVCEVTDDSVANCQDENKVTYNKPVLQVKLGSLTVTKQWADNATTHDAVTVTLYKNDESTGRVVTLDERNGWSATFDKLAPGYAYTVVEETVPGYTTSYEYTKSGNKVNSPQLSVADVWSNDTELKALVTNTLVSVSSLPMTGGDMTLRMVLLMGGVLVLLSGGAWLLSRRRRV